MIKYCETAIVFQEFPDEITLAINISNCPHRCVGCHSPHLQTDTGTELTEERLLELLGYYKGRITCVGFMGGDADIEGLVGLAKSVHKNYPELKVGWYSGEYSFPSPAIADNFEYIKIGPYIECLGPLDSPSTNQRLYKKTDISWICLNTPED